LQNFIFLHICNTKQHIFRSKNTSTYFLPKTCSPKIFEKLSSRVRWNQRQGWERLNIAEPPVAQCHL
jgi:hypothetical protein